MGRESIFSVKSGNMKILFLILIWLAALSITIALPFSIGYMLCLWGFTELSLIASIWEAFKLWLVMNMFSICVYLLVGFSRIVYDK